MATAPTDDAAVAAPAVRRRHRRFVLRRVPYAIYDALRDIPENFGIRMSYLDGTLTLMSPEPGHDEGAEVLGLVVRGASAGMGLALKGMRSGTRRRGTAVYKGSGKEPDTSFSIGDHLRPMKSFRKMKKRKLDLEVDRPPDLAIEVDNSRSSQLALPIYARLGVPEVWRFDEDADQIHFHRLAGDAYIEVDRSVILPRLTPDLVIRALDMLDEGDDMDEYAYLERIKQWVEGLPDPA